MKKKIPAKTTVRLLDGVAFMNYQDGVAFNGMVTVNFRQLGITSEKGATSALTSMNEALADVIRRYGARWGYELPHYFLYAHEDVATSHGHHVHELMVVPRGLGIDLDEWLKAWAKRNFGNGIDDRAVQYGGEYHRDLTERSKTQARLVSYIFKSSADRPLRSREGEPTTLLTLLKSHSLKWKGDRAYCADVRRVAGSSQNIADLAQLRCGFWRPEHYEDVLTGGFLRDHHAALNAEELHRMLSKIDI